MKKKKQKNTLKANKSAKKTKAARSSFKIKGSGIGSFSLLSFLIFAILIPVFFLTHALADYPAYLKGYAAYAKSEAQDIADLGKEWNTLNDELTALLTELETTEESLKNGALEEEDRKHLPLLITQKHAVLKNKIAVLQEKLNGVNPSDTETVSALRALMDTNREEYNRFQALIAEQESIIADLNAQWTDKFGAETVDSKNEAIADKEAEIAAKEDLIADKEAEIADLEAANEQVKAELDELTQGLAVSLAQPLHDMFNALIADPTADVSAFISAFDDKLADFAEYKTTVTNLANSVAARMEKIAALEKQLADMEALKTAYDGVLSAIEALEKEIEDLTKQKTDKENRLTALTNTLIPEAERDLQDKTDKYNAALDVYKKLVARREAYPGGIPEREDKIVVENEKITEADNAVADVQAQCDSTVAEQLELIYNLSVERSTLEEKGESTEEIDEELEKARKVLGDLAKSYEEAIKEHVAAKAASEQEIVRLEKEIEIITDLDQKIEKAKNDLDKAEKEMFDAKKRLEDLKAEQARLPGEIEDLKKQITDKETEKAKKEAEKADLEAKFSVYGIFADYDDLVKEKEDLINAETDEIKKADAQVADMDDDLPFNGCLTDLYKAAVQSKLLSDEQTALQAQLATETDTEVIAAINARLSQITTALNDQAALIAAAQDSFDKKIAEVDGYKDIVNGYVDTYNDNVAAIAAKESEIQTLEDEIAALEAEIAEMKDIAAKIDEAENAIAGYRPELERLDAEHKEFSRKLNGLDETEDAEEIAAISAEITALEEQIKPFEEYVNLQARLNELQESFNQITDENQAQQVREEIEALTQQLEVLTEPTANLISLTPTEQYEPDILATAAETALCNAIDALNATKAHKTTLEKCFQVYADKVALEEGKLVIFQGNAELLKTAEARANAILNATTDKDYYLGEELTVIGAFEADEYLYLLCAYQEGAPLQTDGVCYHAADSVKGKLGTTRLLAESMKLKIKPVEYISTILGVVGAAMLLIGVCWTLVLIVKSKIRVYKCKNGEIVCYKAGRRGKKFILEAGATVSVTQSLQGKIFRYGTIVVTQGTGLAGIFIMKNVRKAKKQQLLLQDEIAKLGGGSNAYGYAQPSSPVATYPESGYTVNEQDGTITYTVYPTNS